MSICCASGRDTKAGRVVCDGHLRLIEVLRVNIAQLKNLPARCIGDNRSITIVVRLDNQDIYQSTSTVRDSICCIGDDFVHEISSNFSQLHFIISENSRIPRPIGRVSVKKRDIVKHSGEDRWLRVTPISKQNDVSGQICVDLHYDDETSSIALRVVDHSGLNFHEPVDLYLLVTLQGCGRMESKKLKIGSGKESDETLFMECEPRDNHDGQRPQIRLSLWHDVLGGFNSYFHGQVRILLDDTTMRPKSDSSGPQWYYLKPRMSVDEAEETTGENADPSRLGELRLRLFYTADHVLPLEMYKPLQINLINSLSSRPFCASPAGILEYLPSIDLVTIARPLMKIFVQANSIRPLLRILCAQDIVKCQDVNTLFRSQTLASKIIYEQMKFLGHQYLVISLKPVIDMIYNERKCCEVDPSKLKHGGSLESNKLNLIVYGEVAFSRVVDSNHRCPTSLREMFADLRDVVAMHFPGREDVQRLALSSFIVMRFFAAAIMNPRLFGLKREQPDPVVARTLVLVSKILQRLSNCVVSGHTLNVKEPWLAPVMQRFTDETHRLAMLKFLDRISMTEADLSISGESLSILRDGFFIERKMREKRRYLKNLISQRRRYVVLTETEICWQKSKADTEPKGRIQLQEVNHIEPVEDAKNVFRIATSTCEIQLQAPSMIEMNEWIVQIQKQRKRQLMIALRTTEPSELFEIDTERELETIHMALYEHAETLKHWKNALEGTEIPEGQPPLPRALQDQLNECENPEEAKMCFYSTIQDILHGTLLIEKAHRDVVNTFMSQIRSGKGTRELPIGDDNYLLLKSRFQKSLD
uniref:Ras GTPase-activating protein gap-1 n=1 Tax=Ascaris suum TaxID=6253 RepID=F1KVG0_ASCSU